MRSIPIYCIILVCLCNVVLISQDKITEPWLTITQNSNYMAITALDTTNKKLAAVLPDNSIQLYSLEDGQATVKIMGHDRLIRSLSLSPNGKWVASGDSDGIVIVWSLANGEQVFRFNKHTGNVLFVTFSQDSKWLASGGSDNVIFVYDTKNGDAVFQCMAHTNEITHVSIWPDNSLLISTSKDNTTRIWRLSQREESAENLAKRAKESKDKGDYNQAIIQYQAAVKFDPKNIAWQYELAVVYALRCRKMSQDDPQYQKDFSELLQALEKTFQGGFQNWVKFHEDFKDAPFEKDARFENLVSVYKPAGVISIKSKPISFDIVDENTKNVVKATEILIANKRITPDDLFLPGYSYEIIVKFKEFQTVQKVGTLITGKDSLIITAPIKKLIRYDFYTKEVEKVFDGVKYPFKFYMDEQEIESHLIEVNKRGVNYYHTIRVSQEAKEFKAIAGYVYATSPFIALKNSFIQAEKLNVPLLIKHLEYLARQSTKDGYRISMISLEQMVRSYYWNSKLRYAPIDDINELINFIETWGFENSVDRDRARMLVDAINSLIGEY